MGPDKIVPDPLDDAAKKLKWAKKQIKNADVLVHNYCQARPWTIQLDRQSEPGKKVARLRFKDEVPEDAIEAVHVAIGWMRSALDSLAWAVACRYGPPLDPRIVKFPIFESRETFESVAEQRKIRELGADWQAFIGVLKPYPGANDPLVALAKLNNADKHRRLSRVSAVNAGGGFDAGQITSGQLSFDVTFLVGALDDGQMVVTVGEQDPDPKIDFSLKIAFAEAGKVADKRPAIEVLRQFARTVDDVIERGRRKLF